MSITKNEKPTINKDGTIFNGFRFNIGKTEWAVVTAEKDNETKFVTVRKVTSNPFGTLGTDFDSFDEAVGNYKNPTMKMNLRLIEMGI